MKPLLKKTTNTFDLLNQNKFLITNSLLLKTELTNVLARKEILTSSINFALSNNTTIITIYGFTRTNKLLKYRRFLKKIKNKNKKTKKQKLKHKKLLPLFSQKFNNFLTKNNIILNYINLNKNLNKKLNKKLLAKNYIQYKNFHLTLFQRNLNLFLDFIKIITLIEKNKINVSILLTILGQIFMNIAKGKHNKFVLFITTIFTNITKSKKSKILGAKFIINGRLKGKPRANTTKIYKGSTELNTITANCIYKKIHVYTVYGAFGFKLWINYKKNTKKIKKEYVICTKTDKI